MALFIQLTFLLIDTKVCAVYVYTYKNLIVKCIERNCKIQKPALQLMQTISNTRCKIPVDVTQLQYHTRSKYGAGTLKVVNKSHTFIYKATRVT